MTNQTTDGVGTPNLPPLPEPTQMTPPHGRNFVGFVFAYTAQQMTAYALEALRLASPQGWISVEERMPGLGPNAFVLATYPTSYGKPRVVRAYFAPRHTIESTGDSDEFADYSEEDDCYYTPEGWYECNAHEETNWLIDEVVTHWMPLPSAPEATKG